MHKKVLSTIREKNLLQTGDKVVIALSGGADSMTLLYLMNEIKQMYSLEIFALHVNHMLRCEESYRDAAFVADFCKKNCVELITFEKDVKAVAAASKMSVEEAGRTVRYRAYELARKKFCANKVLVAHNKNDQVETFLLRLARGAGTIGLRCIDYKSGFIVRPLLDCKRSEIEKYAHENNIPFVTDSTNSMLIYDRNKVRMQLIPWIEQNLNSNIVNTITNSIEIIKEQSDFIYSIANSEYEKCVTAVSNNVVYIDINKINALNIAIKKIIIRSAVTAVGGSLKNVSHGHIKSVIGLLSGETGKKIAFGGTTFERVYNNLSVVNISYQRSGKNTHEHEKDTKAVRYELALNKPVFINEQMVFVEISETEKNICQGKKNLYTKAINCDKIFGKAYFRTRLPGDRITLSCGTKKLKKLFIDNKIPREQRSSIFVAEVDGTIVAVYGLAEAVTFGKYTYYLNIWEDTNGTCRGADI